MPPRTKRPTFDVPPTPATTGTPAQWAYRTDAPAAVPTPAPTTTLPTRVVTSSRPHPLVVTLLTCVVLAGTPVVNAARRVCCRR